MVSSLTGVQRYTQKILTGFPQNIECISPPLAIARGFKGHLWEQIVLPQKIKGSLLWSPSNTGPVFTKRQVVTIHDIVPIDHPEWFNSSFSKWFSLIMPVLCKNAKHIIAISEFTKKRLIEKLNVPESKISMIYNGADDLTKVITIEKTDFNIPFKRYVLSLGSLEPRKNIPLLLNAWKNISNKIPQDIGLIVVGGKGNANIFKHVDISETNNRVYLTGHVPDDVVLNLYQNALFFVYLSIYEGFGLPPLEAMSSGLPVITGNKTSLPEVVGNAGIMIDPFSLAECESSLINLATQPQLRTELSRKAIIQAQKFNWQVASDKTYQILSSN